MKINKLKSTFRFILIAGLISFGNMLFAQNSDLDAIKGTLTVEQREMLQKERQLMKQNREELRASLTEEQLALLKDKKLTQEQMRKKLKNSFSESQLKLLERQENRLRLMKQDFQNCLTDEQRTMLQQRVQQRTRNSGEQGELGNGYRNGGDGTRQYGGKGGGGSKGK